MAARVGLLYDERMCAHATPDGEDHPENPERLRAIWRKLKAEGITSRCVVLKAKEAKDKYIASVHSEDHVKLMKEISSKKDSRRNKIAKKFNSIYFNHGSSESAVLAAGSVIEVAEKVAAGELSSAIALVRPPGHHAEHDKAMGFCLFNNVAVAANYLLNERPDLCINKILIVDWDVHHGNATQKMFYDDPRVLVFSVHRFDFGDFYPYEEDASYHFIGGETGKGYNINVPWEHGNCGDADYIAAWDHILLPVTEAFDPDIILVSAGFDAALGDPLGGCCITPDGYALLLTKLLGFAQGRTVMALEGGYNLRSTANSVFACAKVLLGDKFTFNTQEKQPLESTWRVIQAVRNELKTCWPILSGKVPENVLSSGVHFPLSSSTCPVPKEIHVVGKRDRGTSTPTASVVEGVPLWDWATDEGEGPCIGWYQAQCVMEGSGKSKRRRLHGDEGGEVEATGNVLPSGVHFPLSSSTCPVPKEIHAVGKRDRDTSTPTASVVEGVPLWDWATDEGEGPCIGWYHAQCVMEGSGKSKRRRLHGDEGGEVEATGNGLDKDMGAHYFMDALDEYAWAISDVDDSTSGEEEEVETSLEKQPTPKGKVDVEKEADVAKDFEMVEATTIEQVVLGEHCAKPVSAAPSCSKEANFGLLDIVADEDDLKGMQEAVEMLRVHTQNLVDRSKRKTEIIRLVGTYKQRIHELEAELNATKEREQKATNDHWYTVHLRDTEIVDLKKLQEEMQAKHSEDIKGRDQRIRRLTVDLAECKKSMRELQEATDASQRGLREELEELRGSAGYIADMFVPNNDTEAPMTLLECLKAVPEKVKSLMTETASVCANQVLALVKSHFPRLDLNLVGEGVALDCTSINFEQMVEDLGPVAARVVEQLVL